LKLLGGTYKSSKARCLLQISVKVSSGKIFEFYKG